MADDLAYPAKPQASPSLLGARWGVDPSPESGPPSNFDRACLQIGWNSYLTHSLLPYGIGFSSHPQATVPALTGGAAGPNFEETSWRSKLRLPRFVPGPAVQNMKLLSELANPFGRGLHRYQVRQIMQACSRCNGVCFMEKRHLHQCQGISLHSPRDGPELLEAMLCEYGNRGLRPEDFMGLLSRGSKEGLETLMNYPTAGELFPLSLPSEPGHALSIHGAKPAQLAAWHLQRTVVLMKPFKVDQRIVRHVQSVYPSPQISLEWLRKTSLNIVEAHECRFSFDSQAFVQEVSAAIGRSSLASITEPGTVLELVHLTDIGVSALTLEGVRQEREHRIYLDRVAHTSTSEQAKTLRDLDWLRPRLTPYPRKCLKMFLSDGSVEIQAIETERLCGIELGTTPMGTKVRLDNVPIIAGVAYLRNENVEIVGGSVARLQTLHNLRLYEELQKRMDEDDSGQSEYGDLSQAEFCPQESSRNTDRRGGVRILSGSSTLLLDLVSEFDDEISKQRQGGSCVLPPANAQVEHATVRHNHWGLVLNSVEAPPSVTIVEEPPLNLHRQTNVTQGVSTGTLHNSDPPTAASSANHFFENCRFSRFQPQGAHGYALDLLFLLGRIFGPGVSKAEFMRIWRQCSRCMGICFVDRSTYHTCSGLRQQPRFDIIGAALTFEGNAGLDPKEMHKYFSICGVCHRIQLQELRTLHECPVAQYMIFHADCLSTPPVPTIMSMTSSLQPIGSAKSAPPRGCEPTTGVQQWTTPTSILPTTTTTTTTTITVAVSIPRDGRSSWSLGQVALGLTWEPTTGSATCKYGDQSTIQVAHRALVALFSSSVPRKATSRFAPKAVAITQYSSRCLQRARVLRHDGVQDPVA
ncbi:hypothetical protein NMY22_g2565 [Coprinellus aureogranulatus]|nr:hypothetical protein NMY22_g2565 [Coprinellus aureogranulatus]